MTTLSKVDPESFIKVLEGQPATGRGAWNRTGIDFDYRYALSEDPSQRIGTRAEQSLSHWAVAAGSFAIQKRLVNLGYLAPLAPAELGIFGPRTKAAVEVFQEHQHDPDGGALLDPDGTVGRSDARSLFTPLILEVESRYAIPGRLLVGETNHESAMDPGAVGYYIYYPDYRGVDRSMSQINSKSNVQVSWLQAFDPVFAIDWSGRRLRDFFDQYRRRYPAQPAASLWDATVCAHNNPSAAAKWAATGRPPTEAAAKYVSDVKTAIF